MSNSTDEKEITNDTVIEGLICRLCNQTVPPHYVWEHLSRSPIMFCPHERQCPECEKEKCGLHCEF